MKKKLARKIMEKITEVASVPFQGKVGHQQRCHMLEELASLLAKIIAEEEFGSREERILSHFGISTYFEIIVPEERREEVQKYISEEWRHHVSKTEVSKEDVNQLLEMMFAMRNGEAINGMFWSQKIAEFLER